VFGVELGATAVPSGTALFGSRKCSSADNKGRWLNLDTVGGVCKPPYCSGPSTKMLFDYDWVRCVS
jgi:hypothetical protein